VRLEVGQNVGDRYTLIERIGSGGMADVWSAEDAMLGRQVALKFLHERFAQDQQFVERFRREAQAAAGLQHPNVVGVYDRGEHEGRHWIAMEYVQGASLKDLISRGLAPSEALEIVRQILAGASFAHQRGIVHRDLKPHNVLVDADGRARVTDFGIARAGASEITQTGSVLGTAQYLSPEQAQGFEVDARSDLYSVGVILYEALTGQVPFQAETAVAIALKQVSERPRRPSEINPRVSPALDGVVMRALAKDPDNRFQSADEFLRALDEAESDPTGGDTAAYAAAAGAAAGAGALAAADAAETAVPPPEPDNSRRNRLIALGVVAALIAAVAVWALTRPAQVTVPPVTGKSQAEATQILEDAGFDVRPMTFESCKEPQTVAEQDPRAGSEDDEGSTVDISVSLGLRVTIPDVVGKPMDKATRILQNAELQVDERETFSDSVSAGRVVRTEPPTGDQVECQSLVSVFKSKGRNLVPVPDVLGQSEASAKAELRNAGFIPNVETENSDEPEGTVIAQDPGAGGALPKGTEVAITTSNGAGSVVVPDVEGQPRNTAISILQGRGVTNIKVIEQDTDDSTLDDRVTDQAPSAGARIRQGDRVTLYVAVFVEPEPPPEEEPPPDEATPRLPGSGR
jgi:beta-lactam-binding protein with PASTA domain/predicted Ser/Thr protein kinase